MPAKAIHVAALALSTLLLVPLPSQALTGAQAIDPQLSAAPCAVQQVTPVPVWTTCTTHGDFRASTLTLTGRGIVKGPLFAGDVHASNAFIAGDVRATLVDVSGPVEAMSLAILGTAEATTLQLRVTNAPACVEGTVTLVRNGDGADVLQACLRSAKGTLAWAKLASG